MSARLRGSKLAARLAATLVVILVVTTPSAGSAPTHGRAWELVTTGSTNGVNLSGERAWSPDGERVVYGSVGPMPGAVSGDLLAENLATRTTSGWTHQPIGESFSIGTADLRTSEPLAISSDLSSWLWSSTQPLLPGAPDAPTLGLYSRDPVGNLALRAAAGNRDQFTFVAASDDLHHAVFQSQAHLLQADAGRVSGDDAYELAGSDLRLVGVDAAGVAISTCGSEVGNGDSSNRAALNPVSRDGARIFFSAPMSAGCDQTRRVYLRENGSHTIEVSASACTRLDCNPPQDVTFVGALPDGSSAFLITAQQLTDDDVDDSLDLYRYDVASLTLTRISAGALGVGAAVSGTTVRASDDGGRVYFVAAGALVAGQGVQDGPNLYLSDHGDLRFIATADGIDLSRAALTADGGTFAFATSTPLLSSDTDDSADVYRYDATTATLQEVTVGAGGTGNGAFDVSFGVTGNLAPLGHDDMRYLSADGRRVFFTTNEPLVSEDANQTRDVYEQADGVLGLVTSGSEENNVTYGGSSADGRSVFFTTTASLVAADRNDGDQDLYVARLDGGFPDPAPPPPGCEGDECQGAPKGRLQRQQPSSLTFVEPSVTRIRIRPLDRAARAKLAATGHATIFVEVSAGGRVSLVARAHIDGRSIAVAHDTATAANASSVRLHVRLSATARRALRRHHHLRLKLVIRHSRLHAASTIGLLLRSTS